MTLRQKQNQLNFYTAKSGTVMLNMIPLDNDINVSAPSISRAFSDNKYICNVCKMGGEINLQAINFHREHIRKPSNGCAHIRLEMFHQCLYGRFTRNVRKGHKLLSRSDYECYSKSSDKLVLATDNILYFKNLNFFFTTIYENGIPTYTRIWYWNDVKHEIDEIYQDAKAKGEFYCIFQPKYEDFPITEEDRKNIKNGFEDFYTDWRIYGMHTKKFRVDIFEDGKAKGTTYFTSIKDFESKSYWTGKTIMNLLAGKIHNNKTRVKIIDGKRYVLKRQDNNNLIMEITTEQNLKINEPKIIESKKDINSIDHITLDYFNKDYNTLDHKSFILGSDFPFGNYIYIYYNDLRRKSPDDHDLGLKRFKVKDKDKYYRVKYPIKNIQSLKTYFHYFQNGPPFRALHKI